MNILKRIFMWLGIGTAALIVLAVIIGLPQGNSTPPATARTAPSSTPSQAAPTRVAAPFQITAWQLYNEYKENELAADLNYKGKTLIITGIVDRVGKDFLGDPYIILTDGRQYAWGVQAVFPRGAESQLAQLRKGQSVTIRAMGNGYMVNVLVANSELIK